jgi:ABC-2 type transport system ATP-binding protein
MLHARSLTKWYGAIRAVSDVSFTVAAGEVLGYLGPNGSGKTTTVGMVLGLVEPSGGSVVFRGQDIADDPVDFRRNVGYVPEEPHLYPYLSGVEYLQLVADLRDMDARVSRKRIAALLELFGLEPHAQAALSSYSKGMRQKILISAALLHNPSLLIFDEPVSGLDATSALVFRHLLAALAAAAKAVMYCSHELDAVEKTCSRVIVLHHGTVVADDRVDRLREKLSQASLEGAFQQLVAEVDPAQAASDIVQAMAV